MKHFTSVRVHPCQFKATAFHMHEQSHLKWLFQIKQVKSEQGWGRPEFCTRCWLLIYSLVKQECASSEDPETSGQHPSKRCALHQHNVLQVQVERNEQAEQGAPQGSSHRCCWKPDLLQSSANSIHESPSRNSHLRISLHITKGDPTLFSNAGNT